MTGLALFTLFHVLISLIGIGSGFVLVFGLLTSRWFNQWNSVFLVTTILTSVTGFLFPFHKLLPSHVLGILSLVVLALAVYALYARRLAGGWRRTYAISATVALYFNVFVLIAQLFMKVPSLKVLAPTQSEPPFKVAQLLVLLVFVLLGVFAAKGFAGKQVQAA
jgi:hypothetical protein